jgi:hypothetical protein
LGLRILIFVASWIAMPHASPPQERDDDNPERDRLHDWVKACLAELLRIAAQRRAAASAPLRRRFFSPEEIEDLEDEMRPWDAGRRRWTPHDYAVMSCLNDEAVLNRSIERMYAQRAFRERAEAALRGREP